MDPGRVGARRERQAERTSAFCNADVGERARVVPGLDLFWHVNRLIHLEFVGASVGEVTVHAIFQ